MEKTFHARNNNAANCVSEIQAKHLLHLLFDSYQKN